MANPKSPCKGCEKRHVGCHSECGSYKEFRAEVDDISAKRREAAERNMRLRSRSRSRTTYYKQKV